MEQENREFPVAYPPIPKAVVKQEPEELNFGEDKEEYDGQGQQLHIYR